MSGTWADFARQRFPKQNTAKLTPVQMKTGQNLSLCARQKHQTM